MGRTRPEDLGNYDIWPEKIEGGSREELGMDIAQHIGTKGFCVMNLGFKDKLATDAHADIRELDKCNRFERPPAEVVEGLLGEQGSFRICEMTAPNTPAEDNNDGDALRTVDGAMSQMVLALSPYFPSLDIEANSRTTAFVVQGGKGFGLETEMNENECSKWLNCFLRHKLQMIYFLGPNEGVLELQPFDDDSGVEEIRTEANMLVILRADILSHRHICSEQDFAVMSWVVGPDLTGIGRGVRSKGSLLTPTAKVLNDWAMKRLEEIVRLKESDERDGLDDVEYSDETQAIPREWQMVMSHLYQKGISVCIRGDSCKFPGVHGGDGYWTCLSTGVDYATEVPQMRWDHAVCYDPAPHSFESEDIHHFKTNVRHGCFADGVELFDYKLFGISLAEARGMDPMQRCVLETNYEALFNAGFRKKDLMNSYIGVFTGCSNTEFNYVQQDLSLVGAFAGTGLSQAITSNRVSFCLGMMGPSVSLDTEMSASASAVYLAAESAAPANERRTAAGLDTVACMATGVYLMLSPMFWPKMNMHMNPLGRCFSFDQNANGYIRGEGAGSFCIRPYLQNVDGQMVVNEEEPCSAVLAGYRMSNNGRGGTLQAPSGPAEQMVIEQALRHAGIQPLDVDAVECHGTGGLLTDAVEVGSLSKILRGGGSMKEPCSFGSAKSQIGAAMEACGVMAIMKVIYGQLYGTQIPTLHVKQLNPHIEVDDKAALFPTEAMSYRLRATFHDVNSRGYGGTTVNLLWWNNADDQRIRIDKQRDPQDLVAFSFWPGGGGELELEARPSRGFSIVGSWSCWEVAEYMKDQEDGSYTYTVTLGENAFESFQIWMDGDPRKMLHPGMPKAPSGAPVIGPTSNSDGNNWLIDGRTIKVLGKKIKDKNKLEVVVRDDNADEYFEVANPHRGKPGDRFEVRLRIAGKWRAVTWDKVYAIDDDSEMLSRNLAGSYYVTGAFNDWGFDELDARGDGRHSLEIGPLLRGGGEFQVVRNKDFGQAFYPTIPRDKVGGDVLGPDDDGHGQNWYLDAVAGDVVRIDFQRVIDPKAGTDTKKLAWQKLRHEALSGEQLERARRTRYHLVGTWDNWKRPIEMKWDGECYRYTVKLGVAGNESFQILQDGRWDMRLHPNTEDANPFEFHMLRGPSNGGQGTNWTIGKHEDDKVYAGASVEVRLHLGKAGIPKKVDWGRRRL